MRRPAFCNLLLLAVLFLFALPFTQAFAGESRVALVIGQSAYRAVPPLPNAANDAKHMAELLISAGFAVTSAGDLSQNDMRQAISDFAAKVSAAGPDTVALVFYAGHGLQIDGENFLIPVDLDPKREADVPLQAVRLNDLLNTLGALHTRMRILMLDACRDNPFPALNGSTGHGLAMVDTKAGAPGSFISYSTSPGSEAEDGNGEDSPYTTAVLSIAKQPNLPIEQAFKQIRVAVNQATDGRQIPWESSSLTTDFKFFSTDNGQQPATDALAALAPSKATDAGQTEAQRIQVWRTILQGKEPKVAYDLVVSEDSVEAYAAFVEMFQAAPYGPRIRLLLERRRQMVAWANAVAVNTGPSYQTFLASYPNSDLAATARKLEQRVQNRTIAAPAPLATTVALGPTCPCSTPSLPATPTLLPAKKHVEEEPSPPVKKRVEKSTPKHKQPPEEVVVQRRPAPEQGPPPGAVLEGIGIGVGIGMGMGGGMGGRGGGMEGGGYRR
ncbi:MAG TPA: caspase family protein [Bradyrhizobium sp.]|nr:caspase family protein [Bradyrhizobium sp.]